MSSDQIRRVEFRIDGKRVARLRKANRRGRFEVRVRPAGHRFGTHRLVIKVEFTKASGTEAKTLSRTFLRCGRPAVKPQFTG